jgi:peptide/nickel transport system substrate-binding protein
VPLYTINPPAELRTLGSQSQVNRLLKSLPQYTYNLAKARQQMSDSAYPKGFSVNIDTTNCCGYPDVLQVIASQLQKIGIKLSINEVTVGKLIEILYGPKNFGLMFSNLYAAYPDPSEQAGYLLGSVSAKPGGINAAGYAPKSVDQLLARGLAATRPLARLAIYGELLKKVATDLPYVPLFNFDSYTVLSTKFAMAPLDILNYQLPWALLVRQSH